MPLHTMNRCVKLQFPMWKLTIIDPFTPTSWPFAVLMHVLLSEIWCKRSNSDTVSCLMQLTCAPVSKRDENARSFTLILKVVPFVFTCIYYKHLFFPLCFHLSLSYHFLWLVRPANSPSFWWIRFLLAFLQLYPFGSQ